MARWSIRPVTLRLDSDIILPCRGAQVQRQVPGRLFAKKVAESLNPENDMLTYAPGNTSLSVGQRRASAPHAALSGASRLVGNRDRHFLDKFRPRVRDSQLMPRFPVIPPRGPDELRRGVALFHS